MYYVCLVIQHYKSKHNYSKAFIQSLSLSRFLIDIHDEEKQQFSGILRESHFIGANDVYVVAPADGFGEPGTVNRANLRLCVHGNDHAVAPAVRRRQLPCVPSVISGSESNSQSGPLLYTVQPPHDVGGYPPPPSHSDHHSSSSELSSSENEDRPLPRRTRRSSAGCHSNPGNWPRSVNSS